MKILLVEDHPIVVKGIRAMLADDGRHTVCGDTDEANSAIKLIIEYEPDLAIIDIELKGSSNGIELIEAMKRRDIGVDVLAMSMDDGSVYAERAIKAGAKGFISKIDAPENILTAIETISNNKIYLSERIYKKLTENYFLNGENQNVGDLSSLTNRELQVFQLVGKGYKRKEIARVLSINIKTVENYRRKIREKVDIANSAELSKFAVHWYNEKK